MARCITGLEVNLCMLNCKVEVEEKRQKKQKESSHYALSVNTENPDYDKSQRRPKQKGGGRGLEYCSRNKESERSKMS